MPLLKTPPGRSVRLLILERPQVANRDPRARGDGFQLHATLDPLLLKIPSEPHVLSPLLRCRSRKAPAGFRETLLLLDLPWEL